MMIENSGSIKMNGSDVAYLIFAIIFMIVFYAAIVPTIFIDPTYAAAIGVSWFIYQIMGCCNSSTKYIWGLKPLITVFENIQTAQRSPPHVVFKISCYHNETTYTETRNSDGTTTTSSSTSKVYTHHAS